MPLTTFDIPHDLMEYLNQLVKSGVFQSRKHAVVWALQTLRDLTVHEWRVPFYYIHGRRYGWVSQKTLELLLDGLDDKELAETGRRAAPVLAECCLRIYNAEIRNRDSWPLALKLLQRNGWGNFELRDDKILISQPYLPGKLLQAYLEEALGCKLILRSVSDDETILEIADARRQTAAIKPLADARQK